MDKPLWQMTIKELLHEMQLQCINCTVLKLTFIKEIEKEILRKIKEK